jgi:hypothetical protein
MATNQQITTQLYWTGHILRHAPRLLPLGLAANISARVTNRANTTKICIGTHHKILTVFLSRVFRSFAALSGRKYTLGQGNNLNYNCSVLIDHHSQFDFDRITGPFVGMHITRDPRDLIVSSAFYHAKSEEAWLHSPMPVFQGQTYQQAICALPDIEARLLFEIEHAGGHGVREMLAWTPKKEIAEVRYDQLVGEDAQDFFRNLTESWPLSRREHRLLCELFDYFSIGGPGVKGNKHIRNASSGQWRAHFTPAVIDKFQKQFPDALKRLGYSEDW